MKKNRNVFRILLSVFLVTSLFFQAAVSTFAADVTERTNVQITSFEILKKGTETPIGTVGSSDDFDIRMKWDASSYGNTLKAGDYFTITLPDAMKFPKNHAATNFNLTDDDGNIIATAVVSPKDPGGGTIKVTFTNYVENRYNIKGTVKLQASFVSTAITSNASNTFTVSISGKPVSTTVTITGPGTVTNEQLFKYAYNIDDTYTRIRWVARINFDQSVNLTNAVITDKLNPTSAKYFTDDGTFILREVEYKSDGNVKRIIKEYSTAEVASMVTFNADKNEFKLNLGTVGKKSFQLRYETTYVEGLEFKNSLALASENFYKKIEGHYKSASSGGTGQGDLNSKIKIIKVDSEDNQTKLQGAVFTITSKATGNSFQLTTDQNGEAVSEKLVAGDYTIKEVTPPKGYELNNEEYTVTVTTGGAAIKTITDKPIKIDVSVTKKWVGPQAGSVTVKLYADDVDTGKTLVLDANGNWKGSFTNLNKYKNGNLVKYTVKEVAIANYDSNVTGSQEDGYTITNTNTEKVDIKVTKRWIGPKGTSVTIKLYADDQEVAGNVLVLDENNQWTGSFTGLAKYNANGSEIKYTIKEVAVNNYTSEITGDATNGYIVTNTNAETTSVKVNKTWVGPKKDSVTVKLLADGQATTKTLVLNEANQWSGSFDNLAKYNPDGSEIKYTIEEVKIDNYESKITGSQKDGYTITNTNTEKVDIKVTKRWIGPKGTAVTIKLYADDQEVVGNVLVLDENNQWTGSFTGLAKYNANGSEIKYTIKEVAVNNYTSEITGDATSGYIVTNTNAETTSVKVNKTWVGPKKDSVTVKLLADGQATTKTLVLNEANQWSGSFDGLKKYNDNGSEIKYTIEEVKIDNYESKITGSQKDGYTITNTNIEKTSVKVNKTWVGPKKDSVTVKLLADGQATTKTLVLNEANQWSGSFDGLKKYNDNGSEIKYTIEEVKIDNYESKITGSQKDGYTITNTNIEKTSVKVNKTWVGPKKDSVTVKLLADGKPTDKTLVLKEGNQWQGTFDNLAKYNPDGSEIKYTIEEVKIDNYESKITGSQKDGYTITNTNTEKISVEVIKKWIGKEREAIKVKLYGDGKEIEEVTITKATGWRHSFMNLKKYNDDGSEIKYTIAEEAIEGYSSEISGDASQGYVITNREKPTKPKTGDESKIGMYLGLVGLSLLGILYIKKEELI